MNLPWWCLLFVALWYLPGVFATFALLLQKSIGGLDENGEPYWPVPVLRKVIALPLILVLLVILWPWVLWSEFRHSRR